MERAVADDHSFAPPADRPLVVGNVTLASRLIVGTGKYSTFAEMARCLAASGTEDRKSVV